MRDRSNLPGLILMSVVPLPTETISAGAETCAKGSFRVHTYDLQRHT